MPRALWLLLGLLAALLLVVFAVDSIGGGGHPSLSALLLVWGLYPTLTLFLSRALLGSEFPSPFLMLVGFLEYPLVGVGVASVLAIKSTGQVAGRRAAVAMLLIYIGAQFTAHLLLNLQSVNLRLMADANPAVSKAAVDRIRESGDATAVPALQQKLVEDFEQGKLEAGLIDTLTVLGGPRGWQNLLDSGRLGVAGPAARAWRFIVENVRGKNPDYREEAITRLFDSLALKLAGRLRGAADSEASLTLLSVMKERPDLCRKYFEVVPIGLRDATSFAAVDLVRTLAVMKAGPPADFKYDYQAMVVNNEMLRFSQERDAVAEEWIAWGKSNTPCR